MAKTRKLYEIRVWEGSSYSRSLSPKLRERQRATKLKSYLRRRFGIAAFTACVSVAV